jgi:replicative DNA helicase
MAKDEAIFDDPRHERWMQIAKELYRRTFAEEAPEAIYDWLMSKVGKLRPDDSGDDTMYWPESFQVYEKEIGRRVELAKLPEDQRRQFKWPWTSWNNMIDPAEGGVLAVLAGADGVGKTSYAECISEHWARSGHSVVYVHYELSRIIMLDRRATRHTSIARRRLKLANDLSPADIELLEEAKRRLSAWPGEITYLHTPGKSVELVLRRLGELVGEGKCDAVIIDYLEKASSSAAQLKAFGSNMFAREAADVELLKSWSEANNVPMLVLSQLNKAGKAVDFDDLDRSMIRGAGEKAEKANVVLLLQPDKDKENVVRVRLDKNTLGPTGTFDQFFDAPHFFIGDLA